MDSILCKKCSELRTLDELRFGLCKECWNKMKKMCTTEEDVLEKMFGEGDRSANDYR